jgi:uncharacterized protein
LPAKYEEREIPGVISASLDDGKSFPVSRMTVKPLRKQAAGVAAFGLFIYLELMDASFSFDGVLAAFAISTNVIYIAVSLGIGALFIRTMTVFLVRNGVLDELVHVEHGAHYAIGALAVVLFVGLTHDVPEVVSAGASLVILGAALGSSLHARRSQPADLAGAEYAERRKVQA